MRTPVLRRTFTVPARFSPTRSLLGLLLRGLMADRRQAEATYLIVFPTLILLVILAGILLWPWVAPDVMNNPSSPTAIRLFTVQVAGLLSVLVLCGVGIAPPVRVKATASHLVVCQGRRQRSIPLHRIQKCEVVTAEDYHRQVRPRTVLDPYISRLTPQVVVIQAAQSYVAIGLGAEDCASLVALWRAYAPEEQLLVALT